MSKTTTRLLALALLLPGAAMADVILERTSALGRVPAEYSPYTRCTLDDNGVVTTRYQLADLTSTRAWQTQASVPPIKAAINEAANGAIQWGGYPLDGYSIVYTAFKKRADGTTGTVLLWEGSSGGWMKTNQSPEAMKLKNLIDLNCTGAIQP